MRIGWRRSAALLAAMAAGVGLVAVPGGQPARATDPPVFELPGFPGDLGVLRLHLGAERYFRYDAKSGSGYAAGTKEPINVSGCNIVAPLPTSVALTPTPSGAPSQGRMGLVGGSIGVQVKGEGNGSPCGQVNGTSQAVDLRLAGSLANLEMDSAELDIEAKFGATVKAQLYLDGTVVGTETLPTGGPDSGPDSGDGDNFRWRLPESTAALVLFDQIKLTVDGSTPGGAFSLEGGADGTAAQPGGFGETLGTTDSLFHVTSTDGILGCGDTVTKGGTGGAPNVSIKLESGGACEPVPYALTVSNVDGIQAVAFEKLGGDSNVYRTTVTWPIEASAYPLPPTQIRYPGGPPHDLLWCDGTPSVPIMPATGEFWCLVDHRATLAGSDLMQVTEQLWGQGDPGAWRTA